MTDTIVYPTRREVLLHRECAPPTAYELGFEQYRYLRLYRNPFPVGCEDWWAYDNGNEDARRAEKQEKV